MSNITKEIRQVYKEFKKNHPQGPVCRSLPFNPDTKMWVYHYLYPEMLLVYNDWVREKYKRCLRNLTFEEYEEVSYITTSGEAQIYPCWVLLEEEVLRIMAECKIL